MGSISRAADVPAVRDCAPDLPSISDHPSSWGCNGVVGVVASWAARGREGGGVVGGLFGGGWCA